MIVGSVCVAQSDRRQSLPTNSTDGYKAVRNERWKYTHYFELEGMDELYDLKSDPYEMKNIIHQPRAAKILEELKREMQRLLKGPQLER